jgi:hypothetical protein
VTFRWSSSNPQVATVSQSGGMVTAEAAGGALITAAAIMPNGELGPAGQGAISVGSTGAILATVNVPQGASSVPAAGAAVRAYQNGVERGVGIVQIAGATPGRVYIPGLPTGSYTVTVSLPGYATRTFENVTVTAPTVTQLNAGTAILLQATP